MKQVGESIKMQKKKFIEVKSTMESQEVTTADLKNALMIQETAVKNQANSINKQSTAMLALNTATAKYRMAIGKISQISKFLCHGSVLDWVLEIKKVYTIY